MPFPVILAHGALGPYDEIIMGSVAAIILVVMGIVWVKNRNTRPEFEEEKPRDPTEDTDEPGRFPLD